MAFSDRVSRFGSFKAKENWYAGKEKKANDKEAVLLKIDNHKGAKKTSSSKNKMKKLNPVVLVVSSIEFEDTHVGNYIYHTATGGTQKHANSQIYGLQRQ